MAEMKSYYAIIPATVRYCEDLTANAKLMYGEITALSNEQGYCWANNFYFANLYKVDKNTISRWVSSLERNGFIRTEVDRAKGNSRKIFLSDAYLQNSREVSTKMYRGYQQKEVEPRNKIVDNNNTYNNKDNTKESSDALAFLKSNYPTRYADFYSKHIKPIKDIEKFELHFNATAEQEKLEYDHRVLFGRLTKYASAWRENAAKYSATEDVKPAYLRKIS
jgi:DNA-binding PadR family transcriptional regulator